MLGFPCGSAMRCGFGFHNPNHAAAFACALLPLCWGWRRYPWLGRLLSLALFLALLMTRSRTGLAVAVAEAVMWSCLRKDRPPAPRLRSRWLTAAGIAALAVAVLWWMWPRMALDGSILNRPRIWLAGLQLFAANPDGVGLGNSGAVASAFLLEGVPEIRTMVSAHLTLLAEFGWLAGWTWLSFIGLALCGVRSSPRIGIAFAGLALSGCSSTVFDWPVLLDFAERGGLGMANWVLSWMSLALFLGLGAWLAAWAVRRIRRVRPAFATVALAGMAVLGLRLVPPGDAPRVRGGWAVSGDAPRTLALHDGSWSLRAVRARAGADAVIPVRPVLRFPHGAEPGSVDRVLLFGRCREWAHLVEGVPASCVED